MYYRLLTVISEALTRFMAATAAYLKTSYPRVLLIILAGFAMGYWASRSK
jgi:hypothetical protein